jgi:rod shape-determining protein MreD
MAREAPWQRLDYGARKFLPAMSAFFLGIVTVLPVGIPQWGALAPPLILMAVFYWALVRPDLLPPSAAFGVGLFADLLTGAPLGSQALIMVVAQWTLRDQGRFLANRPFFLMWAAFAPVVAVATGVEWLVNALFALQFAPILGELARMILGFVLFPVVAWVILIPIHRVVPSAER